MKQVKRNKLRRFGCAFVACLMAAAGEGAGIGQVTALAQEAMGAYGETYLEGPYRDGYKIYALRTLDDGTVRAFAEMAYEEEAALWDSADGGETWEKAAALPDEVSQGAVMNAALAPDGAGACVILKLDEDGNWADDDSFEMDLLLFDADGEVGVHSLRERSVASMAYTAGGELVTFGWSEGVQVIDLETGAAARTLYPDSATAMTVCGDQVLILRGTDVLRYDAVSGEPLEADTALEEALFAGGADYEDRTGFGHPIVFTADDQGRLYYCNHEGLFCHVMDGGAVEQLVDGAMTSLADPSLLLMAMEKVGESFLVSWWNDDGNSELVRYAYDPALPASPQKELRVYSLRGNEGIGQVIAAYRKAHPETYVNVQTGMTGDDAVTVSDALRTLSTDMLSGNGPDVLLLDGIDVATFTDRGLLLDLSEVLADTASADGLEEQIAYTYRQGSIVPAVPAWFTFPVLNAVDALRGQVKDLGDIAALSDTQALMSYGGLSLVPINAAWACSPLWLGEDGAVDEAALTDYYAAVKRIFDNGYAMVPEDVRELLWQWFDEIQAEGNDAYYTYNGLGGLPLSLMIDKDKLDVGNLYYPLQWCGLLTADGELGDRDISLFAPTGEGSFVPLGILAVAANAREKEEALSFVRFALSAEGQQANKYGGFAVNRRVLEDSLYRSPFGGGEDDADEGGGYVVSSGNSQTGEYVELTYVWPDKEQADALLEMIDRLTLRTQLSDSLLRQVVEAGIAVVRGDKSPQEAAREMGSAAALMLAEK